MMRGESDLHVAARLLIACAAVFVLAGCSIIPDAGPSPGEINSSAKTNNRANVAFIDVDQSVVQALSYYRPPSLYATFGDYRERGPSVIGVGDVLNLAVYEEAPNGLFSPAVGTFSSASTGAHLTQIPPQVVDRSGQIAVPYGGRINVLGRTPHQVETEVETALKAKAINPQAIVNIAKADSQSATVIGESTGGGRIPLNPKGDRLLEVVAQAGGVKSAPHETSIRLTRGRRSMIVPFQTVAGSPNENIYVQPGDTITVYREPHVFVALGAVNVPGELPLDRNTVSLASAVGKARGLADKLADSSAVFVFRWESPAIVRRMKTDSNPPLVNNLVPVVYRLSFRDANGFFQSQSFLVRDNDVIYVANAPGVEFTKFMSLVTQGYALTPTTATQMALGWGPYGN